MKVCRCDIFIFILNILFNHIQGKVPNILHAVAILPRIDLSIGNEHIFSKRSVSLSADSNLYHIVVFIFKNLLSSSIKKDNPWGFLKGILHLFSKFYLTSLHIPYSTTDSNVRTWISAL